MDALVGPAGTGSAAPGQADSAPDGDPRLRAAFLLERTLLLVRIVRPSTRSCWIRYARQVTARRLEDAIVDRETTAAECPAALPQPATASAAPAHIGA